MKQLAFDNNRKGILKDHLKTNFHPIAFQILIRKNHRKTFEIPNVGIFSFSIDPQRHYFQFPKLSILKKKCQNILSYFHWGLFVCFAFKRYILHTQNGNTVAAVA